MAWEPGVTGRPARARPRTIIHAFAHSEFPRGLRHVEAAGEAGHVEEAQAQSGDVTFPLCVSVRPSPSYARLPAHAFCDAIVAHM